MNDSNNKRFAVLIDADNVPPKKVALMIEEITKYGTPTFKRIYGDWTKPQLNPWKEVLLENSITPIQQYSYTKGKNASDSAMIIDAMDILYTGNVEGFCIISSDSDFTRLASRLREAGMFVIGIGEKKTLPAFISACEKFIYLEILGDEDDMIIETNEVEPFTHKKNKTSDQSKKTLKKIDHHLIKMITNSIHDLDDQNGWVYLGDLGNLMIKKFPDFDPRNYGVGKLKSLIEKMDKKFELLVEDAGVKNIKHIYVRVKDKSQE